MSAVRDQAVRYALGMPKRVVAALCGVSVPTLRLYEADPLSVSDGTRGKCSAKYRELRVLAGPLLGATP